MKAFGYYLVMAFALMSFQSLFFRGIKPDFVIILVSFYALRYGQFRGVVFGVVTGLVLDSASGFVMGPNILSKSVAAFLVTTVRHKIFFWNSLIHAGIIAVASILDIVIIRICLQTFMDISYSYRSISVAFFQIVLTSVISLFTYPLLEPHRRSMSRFRS